MRHGGDMRKKRGGVMSILDSMPHTATAKRRTRTRGALGGSGDTFPDTLFEDRACWQQQATDREVTEFDKRGISVTDKIYFTSDPELDERDIVTVTNNNAGTVTTFEVVSRALPDASAGMGVVFRVMVVFSTTGSTSEDI